MATDEQLIEQIKNGAREAYGQLFSKYYQRIYNTCLFILKNPQDAEEVTQEAFVDSYLKLGQLKSPGKFFAWLKSIAKNRSIKYLHRKQREIVRSGGVLVGSGVVPLTQIAPDELLLRQELIDAIMEAIESLPHA
jgi:RNA polymerase sigma-70 factor (ECF subfamily)